MNASGRAGIAVVSRRDCPLCEDMILELGECLAGIDPALAAAVEVLDVDADAVLQRRHGLKVPVLLLDGEVVCHGHLDAGELARLLSRRPKVSR